MELHFHKYHGTGNDFILVDGRFASLHLSTRQIARLCDRHFGIGADGLIILDEAKGFDFRMTYYNSDGNESTMCGNGGRCIVAFADFLSLSPEPVRFIAADGEHTGIVLGRKGDTWHVKLSMNDVEGYRILHGDHILDTGSPHLVRFVKDAEHIDVVSEGRAARYLDEFQPGGINVNFVEEKGGGIFVRTYERGVEDETLSCGTGVTASSLVYAGIRQFNEGMIPVMTRGGSLSVHFKKKDTGFTGIWLEGPATKVFHGTMDI